MPDLTVSPDIDTFMQSADNAAARTALGVVSGPASSTSGHLAVFNTANGDSIEDSGVLYTGLPVMVTIPGISVLTGGSPNDVASITLPSWLTRFQIWGQGTSGVSKLLATAASGTLAAASFTLRDAAAGGGNAISNAVAGPVSQGITTAAGIGNVNGSLVVSPTGNTIYLRQTADAANTGTVTLYLFLAPMI